LRAVTTTLLKSWQPTEPNLIMADSLNYEIGMACGDSVLASLLQHILNGAAAAGLPAEAMRLAAGLPAELPADANARVPAIHLESWSAPASP